MKPEIFAECAPLREDELEVVLKYMGSFYYGDHTNIFHILTGIGIWTYVDLGFLLI
jgi:hypothetical protein